MTPEQIIAMVKRLQAAGLVYPGEGTVAEWTIQFQDVNPEHAWDACTKIISRTVRGPVTIGQMKAAIRDEAMWGPKRIPEQIPRQHECIDHPGNYGYNCPECRKRAEDPATQAEREAQLQELKALAKEKALAAQTRSRDRADELRAQADESARRAAEKLEKKRQLDAYRDHQPPETPGAFSSPKEP